MTDLSTLTGSELSTRVVELRGGHRPDRNIRQAMELLEDGIVHWLSTSLPESSRGKYGVSFSVIINGGPTYTATAWSNVYAEAFARAICEAWIAAMEKAREKAREK